MSAVALKKAPIMMCYYEHYPMPLILDTGAEFNVIGDVTVKRLGVKVLKTNSQAQQVDKSPLLSIGRISIPLSNADDTWNFEALVCSNIGDIIIAGNPFLEQGINPITYRNITEILSKNGQIRTIPWRPLKTLPTKPVISIVRAPEKITIYPDEFCEIQAPQEMVKFESSEILILPRLNSNVRMVECSPITQSRPCPSINPTEPNPDSWPAYDLVPFPPPQLSHIIGGRIRIFNPSPLPVTLPKHTQLADIRLVSDQRKLPQYDPSLYPRPKPSIPICEVEKVNLDPDNQLSDQDRKLFNAINKKYSGIFSSKLGKYNGSLGNLDAQLVLNNSNIDPPSFPCKRIVQSEKLDDMMQDIMDQMEADGILARPEDVGVQLSHVHQSYMLPKMEDGTPTGEYRLVTNLQSLSPYIKPTRIPLPTIDEAFRKLGRWKYIVLLDLRSWHWQIPMAKSSLRYLGTSTPYGGDRVYVVQPQGYLNATENSDRLIQKVLEPAVRQKKCIRMADNMIVGGSTVAEAADNYELLLKLCGGAGLTFKASKTTICPMKINILGKIWKQGTLLPSEHLMSTLAKVQPPVTVKQLRSFLGASKQMKDNLPNYSDLFQPLEKVTGGRKSGEKIVWNESLRAAFDRVQKATEDPDVLALAKPGEKLYIFPDWSDENQSGGAPLYVKRESKWQKVRNFCQRLRAAKRWSPCEGEAWMIRVGVENHSPWICQSGVPCEVATDNTACVLSFQRLRRGQFSRSVRVAFLLSTLAEHNVFLTHRSGTNHPGDYDSRHPLKCNFGPKCQVCIFAHNLAGPMAQELAHPGHSKLPPDTGSKNAYIGTISVEDVLNGKVDIPFTQRGGWRNIQDEDKTLQTLKMHMTGGTIPMRRKVKQPELRKLYNLFQHQKLTIAKDGLIVKINTNNVGNTHEVIVVPSLIMKGILTALHIKCDHPHPSKPELKKICDRYWFSTDLNSQINSVWLGCHECQALAPVPREIFQQTTSRSGKLGSMWSADVIRGDRQFIFIAREKLSSFTVTKIIENEKSDTLREAIITTTAELIPEEGMLMQVDNCTALAALEGDAELRRFKIVLDLARKKNKDSNPIAEKAVKEFRQQKLKFKIEGGKITDTERALITSSLNKLIRGRDVSAREIILNRAQHTSEDLNLDDEILASKQESLRLQNHPQSAKSKVRKGVPAKQSNIWPGALVFLKKDLSKLKGRELYIVVSVDEENPEFCLIKKAVKQLRVENYKVKLTEISLSPNQSAPEASEDQTENLSNDEENTNDVQEPQESKIGNNAKYNLRKNTRKNYLQLNEGQVNLTPVYVSKDPPKYAWDSFEDETDDEEERVPMVIKQFQAWCVMQPSFLPPESVFLHWFKDKYPTMDTFKLQSLAKSLIMKANIDDPNVSRDETLTESLYDQSDPSRNETIDPSQSGSSSSSLASLPLGQGTPPRPTTSSHFATLSSPLVPTARHSSTDRTWLDTSPLESPHSPPQPVRQSVVNCPTGSCDKQYSGQNDDVNDDDVFTPLAPSPDNADGHNLPVTPANYPILFNLLEPLQPNPAEHLHVADDQVAPVPPRPPDDPMADDPMVDDPMVDDPMVDDPVGRPRRFPRINYQSLNEFGKQGMDAWEPSKGEDPDEED